MAVIRKCHEDAVQILKENVSLLHALAAHLLEKETITGEEFMQIMRDSDDA